MALYQVVPSLSLCCFAVRSQEVPFPRLYTFRCPCLLDSDLFTNARVHASSSRTSRLPPSSLASRRATLAVILLLARRRSRFASQTARDMDSAAVTQFQTGEKAEAVPLTKASATSPVATGTSEGTAATPASTHGAPSSAVT